jgi:hypothetical protein
MASRLCLQAVPQTSFKSEANKAPPPMEQRALWPLASYLDVLGKRALLYRIPDMPFGLGMGSRVEKGRCSVTTSGTRCKCNNAVRESSIGGCQHRPVRSLESKYRSIWTTIRDLSPS